MPAPEVIARRRARPGTGVLHRKHERLARSRDANVDARRLRRSAHGVFHRILDQRLQQERRNHCHANVRRCIDGRLEASLKTNSENLEILLRELDLARQRLLRLDGRLQRRAQQVAQARDHSTDAARIAIDERRHRVERVEQEVRIQLALQRVQSRFGKLGARSAADSSSRR